MEIPLRSFLFPEPADVRFNRSMKRLMMLVGMLAMTVAAHAEELVYRHIVLLKFKDGAPAAEVKKIEDAFVGLKGKIDLIQDMEWGTNVSPENINQGFTHVYFVTFKSKADLEKYLPHPAHAAFGKLLGPQLDKVLVVDYVPKAK